jgi:N utilization substance protein B
MASRHLSRSIVLQSLYEWDFSGKKHDDLDKIVEKNIREYGPGIESADFIWALIKGVVEHIDQMDKIIEKAAPEWPIDQITIVDRNVLRIGLYELLFASKEEVPPKVAINEAIELAKNFGGESSGKFINGVLGTVYKEISPEQEEEEISEEILAAGVIYRKNNDNYKFALVRDFFDYWTFPKGHQEPGEDLVNTALREVGEEIGLKDLKIIKKIGVRVYKAKEENGNYVKKKITDFLFESVNFKEEIKAENSSGIKEAKWFNMEEIPDLKQYPEPKEVLEKVIDYLKKE